MFSFAKIEMAGALPQKNSCLFCAGFMLIASGVRALAWLNKEEQTHFCHFATLALLAGDSGSFVSKGSTQKGQESTSKCVTLTPS